MGGLKSFPLDLSRHTVDSSTPAGPYLEGLFSFPQRAHSWSLKLRQRFPLDVSPPPI